jgi:protein tyrosine phosphatase
MHAILSENGKRMMRDVLGIKTDIDLRGESIGFTMESPIGNDIKFIQVALWAYEDYLKEGNFSNIVKIFDVLADKNNYPVFFHCWGGADRTGCLAFTIEAILGVSEEILMQDFELTCLSFFGNIKSRTEKEFSAMVETLKEQVEELYTKIEELTGSGS